MQDNIGEQLKIERFSRQDCEVLYDYERVAIRKEQKGSELEPDRGGFENSKRATKTDKMKSSAAEIGPTIIDGIDSMNGTPKVKRKEQQIAVLQGVIAEKEQENNPLKKRSMPCSPR